MAVELRPAGQRWWYTPDDQKGEDNPTRFQSQKMTQEQLLEVSREMENPDPETFNMTARGVKLCLSYGGVGWEHVIEDGKEVDFNPVLVRDLPNKYRVGWAWDIFVKTQLGEDSRKNSSSQ